jgi:hypothetical protein
MELNPATDQNPISPLTNLPQHYYAIYFETGYSKYGAMDATCYVRCVR